MKRSKFTVPRIEQKAAVMGIITDTTSVDLTCDNENQDSMESLPTSPVNDVSIEIPQDHQQSTSSKSFTVLNSAGEGSVDEQKLADKHRAYENEFTPINAPKASASITAAAQFKDFPDETATTVHAPRFPGPLKSNTEIQSLPGFSKVGRKTRVSRKFRTEEEKPRNILSSTANLPISKTSRLEDIRQNSREPLPTSEDRSHQVASFTPSDSPYTVFPAHPKSFASNPAARNSSVEMIPYYLSPPIPISFNNLSYQAPKDPSVVPVFPAASLPVQDSVAESLAPRTTICGNCGEAGHNLRTCTVDYCSYCAQDGHKLGDCALAKGEAKAIKKWEAEAAGGR